MLSLEECRKYLGDPSLSNEELELLRADLYVFVEKIFDKKISTLLEDVLETD